MRCWWHIVNDEIGTRKTDDRRGSGRIEKCQWNIVARRSEWREGGGRRRNTVASGAG
jgi:hypothetical protein